MLGSPFPLCHLNVALVQHDTLLIDYIAFIHGQWNTFPLSHSSSLRPLLDISNQISFGSFHSHQDVVPFGFTTPHSVQLCQ